MKMSLHHTRRAKFIGKARRIGRGLGVLGLFMSVSAFPLHSSLAMQTVVDPQNLVNTGKMVTTLGAMTRTTNQINSHMFSMNNAIGTVLGPLGNIDELITLGLSFAGGCGDPFRSLKDFFLGLGKGISPSFNFCDLVGGQTAYTQLLFVPFDQWGSNLGPAQINGLERTRQQMIQQSSANALAISALQKKEVSQRREQISKVMAKAMQTTSFREDMRYANQMLAIIAQELTNIRLLQIHQTEVQASLAAEHVRLR